MKLHFQSFVHLKWVLIFKLTELREFESQNHFCMFLELVTLRLPDWHASQSITRSLMLDLFSGISNERCLLTLVVRCRAVIPM